MIQRRVSAVLVALATALLGTDLASAQLSFDRGAGPARQGSVWVIPDTQGTRSGGNLLHSFEQFDLGAGETALFLPTGPTGLGVESVISRVTGGQSSFINGAILSEYPGASFFLINPDGLVFGPGAEVDVGGSFFASTAHTLHFAETTLATADANSLPVLELPELSAFGFVDAAIAPIQVQGSRLIAPRDIGFIGGDIEIIGGDQHLIRARADGNVWVASVASSGLVTLPDAARGAEISATNSALGTLTLRDGAVLSSSGVDPDDLASAAPGSGFVSILASALDVSDSQIRALTTGNLDGRGIRVEADAISIRELESETGLFARRVSGFPLIPSGRGSAGDIELRGETLLVSGGAEISASTSDAGAGGAIRLEGFRSVEVSGRDPAGARSAIFINTTGDGDAGSLTLASQELVLDDFGALVSQTRGAGRAGNIQVDVGRLEIRGNGRIDASTRGPGDGGAIRVAARERIALQGALDDQEFSGITSLAQPESSGSAGVISVDAPEITLDDGARISAASLGTGVANQVALGFDAAGGPGTLDSLMLRGGSVISVEANGESDAGDVQINAKDLVEVDRSRISASVRGGQGGNIVIDPEFVIIRNSEIVATADAGDGGNIQITAANFFASESQISASSNFGVSGSVEIRSPSSNVSGDLGRLSEEVLDPAALLREHCAARTRNSASSLIERGAARPALSFRTPRLAAYRSDASHAGSPGLRAQRAQAHLLNGALESAERDYSLALSDADAATTQQIRLDQAVLALARSKRDEAVAGFRSVAESEDAPYATRLRAKLNGLQHSLTAGEPATAEIRAEMERLLGRPDSVENARLSLATIRLLLDSDPEGGGGPRVAELLKRAARVAAEQGDAELEAHSWSQLGELYAARGQSREALVLARRALLTAQRGDLPYLRQRLDVQLGLLLKDSSESQRATDLLQRAAKTLALLRLAAAQRATPDVLEPPLDGEALFMELADALISRAKSAPTLASQQRFLREARSVLEDFNAVEVRNFFQDECVAQQRVAQPDSLPGAVVVYPVLLRDRTELIVSHADQASLITVPVTEAQLMERVRALRRTLQQSWSHAYIAPAQDLYAWLLRPLEPLLAEIPDATLVFVPVGDLRGVPLAALRDEASGRFAVEKWPIAIAPGLELTDPKRIQISNAKSLKVGLSLEVQGFPPLPQVKEELAALDSIFAGTTLLDQEFRASELSAELAANAYDIVHVASHASFGAGVEEAYLLTYDGRLAMDRLATMVDATRFRDTPLELLALSACDTAIGDDRSALGIAGVSIRAGARSTLATLWAVNDQASSVLVTRFYRELSDSDRSRAEALRQAQLALIRDSELNHPVYWAPFILIGSWL